MPSIVDPMDAFVTFQPALRRGEIELHRGDVDPNVFVHLDHPKGEPRYTYVRLEGQEVTAMAVFLLADPYEGKPCLQIGYAVAEHLRGQGRAKDVAKAAIAELHAGMGRNGVRSFYIEAIVGADNPASQHVADALFSVELSIGVQKGPLIGVQKGL